MIRGLQDKKQRQKYDQFIVEGEKSITELLTSKFTVIGLYALPEWIRDNQQALKGVKCEEISPEELKQISSHQAPQKVLALVKIPLPARAKGGEDFILALDSVQDPGNLGAIIRIADWYGIRQVICNKGCTDPYSPKCINSTMGSFTRVEIVFGDIVEIAQDLSLPLISATLEGKDIHAPGKPGSGIVVIGNEGHGIHETIIQASEHKVSIPRFGGAESLNAAISTAIILDNLVRG